MSKMKNKYMLITMIFTLAMYVQADDQVRCALEDVMRYSSLSDDRIAQSVPEWGIEDSLKTETTFTNLVKVVKDRVAYCDSSFVNGFTNEVERAVFIAALAECGQTIYRDSVVRWFGSTNVNGISLRTINEFVSPCNSPLENHFVLHYNEPGINNVWRNIKALYLAASNTVQAAGIDDILNGEAKEYFEAMLKFEAGK